MDACIFKGRGQALKVAEWNRTVPSGTKVTVRLDDGRVERGETRSAARLLGGHTAVVWLVGRAACFMLSRVAPEGL